MTNLKTNILSKRLAHVAIAASLLTLAACSDNDDPEELVVVEPVTSSYDVTITNLTYSQPFSPVAVVLHNEGTLWNVGEPATEALEKLAESGDSNDFLAISTVTASASGAGLIMPGMSETITISIDDNDQSLLTLATMLVNTNDAFTGLNGINLQNIAVGDTWSTMVGVYDAGTEGNSELSGTIPGPADGGVGFDIERDDVDFVSMHPGVVSMDDGLMTSVLMSAHKFDQPTAKISITKTE